MLAGVVFLTSPTGIKKKQQKHSSMDVPLPMFER